MADEPLELCVLVHGMGGNANDWDVWSEVLTKRFPAWRVVALASLAEAARPMALGVDELAAVACEEILSLVPPAGHLTLHCVGHSMGGIIIRGALPGLLERLGERVTLGHYLSLSTPHLGIRASWSSPLHAWRNLAAPLTAYVTSQISQLAVANEPEGPAYMLALSDPGGPYMDALRRFRRRTCVSVADGDRLVSLPSGIIDLIRPKPETLKQVPRLQRLRSRVSSRAQDLLEAASIRSSREGWTLQHSDRPVDLTPSERRAMSSARSPGNVSTGTASTTTTSTGTWMLSEDGSCKYPGQILEGLESLPWRRLIVSLKRGPFTSTAHVFLIAKKKHQWPEEHRMSRSCVERLADLLSD